MSTRSITVVYQDSKPLVTIYRHHDGYLECHGADLVDFVANRKIVNGEPNDSYDFNGMGDLAARLVTYLVNDGHSIYIEPSNWSDWQYKYELYKFPNGQVGMRVFDNEKELYYGRVKDFNPGATGLIADIESAAGDGYVVTARNDGSIVLIPKIV